MAVGFSCAEGAPPADLVEENPVYVRGGGAEAILRLLMSLLASCGRAGGGCGLRGGLASPDVDDTKELVAVVEAG